MKDWRTLTKEAAGIAVRVGRWMAEEQKRFKSERVQVKDHNSLVSYVDKQAETQLVDFLGQLLPDAGFITEEDTVTNERKSLSWIIDPLDGTTNFIHGMPIFAVSIGLLYEDELVSGVVYECGQQECFTASKGGGAFCNGQAISVSATNHMSKGLFATGFPYYDYGRLDAFQELLTDFFQNTRGLRRLGSAATDLAWVACGRFDGFFEYGLSPWDVAGGALLVQEAGGKLCDFDGGDDYLFGKTIISANGLVFDEFRNSVQQRMSSNKHLK